MRAPPFRPDKPAMWFAQIEGQFALSGITADTTKFYYVTSQLDAQFAHEVEDIIITPPATGKYDYLKAELIRRLSASTEQRFDQLLREELGDRKPTQFLRRLRHLATPGVTDDFLKTIWSSRLPLTTQTIIASQQEQLSLESLADMADRVHDVVPPNHQVASTSVNTSSATSHLESLTQQVAILTQHVEELSSQRSRSRNRAE